MIYSKCNILCGVHISLHACGLLVEECVEQGRKNLLSLASKCLHTSFLPKAHCCKAPAINPTLIMVMAFTFSVIQFNCIIYVAFVILYVALF